ncbi:MAG TPA: hypothetical protein VNT60_07990 [Deinococcales bacterium]|nr:hypothetical protein [Deinococcales bacterium]
MDFRKREVWQDVEISLELALEFDPEAVARRHPGVVPVLAELLIGPPRAYRSLADIEPLAGLRTLEGRHERLRFTMGELHRAGLVLDRLFAALEFNVVGRRVSPVRVLGPTQLPEGWGAASPVWSCLRPLDAAA